MQRRPTAAIAVALALTACSGGEQSDPLVARGRSVYLGNCVACHATNPAQDGALGPAVAGASRELLEARLLRGEYPPGYTPKRATGVMPLFENLAPEIGALAAFLVEDGSGS